MKLLPAYFGLALILALMPGVAEAANFPPAVTGDLIVKFKDDSHAGAVLAQALRSNPNQHASLQALARQLSGELGMTLAALRATSGQELVLGIDRVQLAQTLKERLTQESAVQRATVIDAPKTLLPATELVVKVKLSAASAAHGLVQRERQVGRRTSAIIDKLVAELSAGVYPQPAGRLDDAGQLLLTLDLSELTRDVVARLKRRPDVVYAQPNLIVRPSLKREISPPRAGPQ